MRFSLAQCSKHCKHGGYIGTLGYIYHSSSCLGRSDYYIVIKNFKICSHFFYNFNNFPISLQRFFIYMNTFYFIVPVAAYYSCYNPKCRLGIVSFNCIIKRSVFLISFNIKTFIVIIFYFNSRQF